LGVFGGVVGWGGGGGGGGGVHICPTRGLNTSQLSVLSHWMKLTYPISKTNLYYIQFLKRIQSRLFTDFSMVGCSHCEFIYVSFQLVKPGETGRCRPANYI